MGLTVKENTKNKTIMMHGRVHVSIKDWLMNGFERCSSLVLMITNSVSIRMK